MFRKKVFALGLVKMLVTRDAKVSSLQSMYGTTRGHMLRLPLAIDMGAGCTTSVQDACPEHLSKGNRSKFENTGVVQVQSIGLLFEIVIHIKPIQLRDCSQCIDTEL